MKSVSESANVKWVVLLMKALKSVAVFCQFFCVELNFYRVWFFSTKSPKKKILNIYIYISFDDSDIKYWWIVLEWRKDKRKICVGKLSLVRLPWFVNNDKKCWMFDTHMTTTRLPLRIIWKQYLMLKRTNCFRMLKLVWLKTFGNASLLITIYIMSTTERSLSNIIKSI